jgi:hypothetical protein
MKRSPAAQNNFDCLKNKKPAGACGASGLKSESVAKVLCTLQRARRMAVMMMVGMRVRVE